MSNWHKIQIISEKEANNYILTINKLKCKWISRSPKLPFYTLGMSAYLDKNKDYFTNKQKKYNDLLKENFKDLYNIVSKKLSILLKSQVEIYDKGCYPGFHIYLPNDNLKEVGHVHSKNPHIDAQFRYLFPEDSFKKEDFISFTLALSCSNESGLDIWKPEIELPDNVIDFIDENGWKNTNSVVIKYINQAIYCKPSFVRYNSGSLFVHNGLFYHNPVLRAEKIARITLQGHGIRKNGKFLIFW